MGFGALFVLAKLHAECLKLLFAEGVLQRIEHVLRASLGRLGGADVAVLQHVGKDLHLAPKIVVHQPFDEFAHRLGPRLIVEYPEDAASLPGRYQTAVRELEQQIVVG